MTDAPPPSGVDLKTFLATALVQIIEGVQEARETVSKSAAGKAGAVISPALSHYDKAPTTHGPTHHVGPAHMVMFDVAVTVGENSNVSGNAAGKAGWRLFVVSASAGASSQLQSTTVSRMKFEVPILYPSPERSEERVPIFESGGRPHGWMGS